ncbi:ATP synthase F0 subunit B [Candidatus Magnetominusculus dajiuhuensis]|uniref:ATP synthase F0 subunit B n=1 Tax=Candidatus Magnetominusculus dajiuhuensis TaxID=3137712 RepID=UPI003B4384CC
MVEFSGLWFSVLVINFLVLLVLLNSLLFKPLLGMIKERQKIRNDSLNEAKSLTDKKEKALQQLKSELAAAQIKAKEIYTKIRQEGLDTQHALVARSHEEAMKRLNGALSEISKEVEKTTAALKGDIEGYADEIVGKLTHGYVKNN